MEEIQTTLEIFRDSSGRIKKIYIPFSGSSSYHVEEIEAKLKVKYGKHGELVGLKLKTDISDLDEDFIAHHDEEYPFELELGGEDE